MLASRSHESSRCALPIAGLLLSLQGCAGASAKDASVILEIVEGQQDPLELPATANRANCNVGTIEITVATELEQASTTWNLSDNGTSFSARFSILPAAESRVSILGHDSADPSAICSGGRSFSFGVGAGEAITVPVFFGPLEWFTRVDTEDLPGPRMDVVAARLGTVGALVVGGYEIGGAGLPQLAEPGVILYRHGEARVCRAPEPCLGVYIAPRQGASAVTLSDGSVVFGLGRLASNQPDNTLYHTQADGMATVALELKGDALPPLYGAGAVVLADGSILIVGGHDGTSASASVFRVYVSEQVAQVNDLHSPMLVARSFPGVAVLRGPTPSVLIVGGQNRDGFVLSGEQYELGLTPQSELVDAVNFPAARTLLLGPRLQPSLVELPSDDILICGGGTPGLEVFSGTAGAVGGFITVAPPPTGFAQYDLLARATGAAAVRAGGRVLIAGGEPNDSLRRLAAFFRPAAVPLLGEAPSYYDGAYDEAEHASTVFHAKPALVALADESILLAGGGVNGEDDPLTTANPGAPRLEVMVLAPQPH
jgi:hypothetical protein